nr:S41 family peptidase [Flexithrix dorotheae]
MRMRRFKIAIISLIFFTFLASFGPNDKYFEIAKNLDIFATLFKEVNRYYVDEVDPTELVNIGINSMLSTLDPYTNYIPEEQIDDYRTMTTGEYGGIGAVIGRKNNKITVLMPNEGYAAEKAGVQIGDELLKIDGQEVKDLSISEISKLLKGNEGSPLEITLKRMGNPESFTLNLTRERIHLNNVPYYGLVADDIGFIQLTDFTQNASKEVKNALIELKKEGAKKIILDLRGNPGGLLSEAINIANIFLPRGSEVVSTRGKIQEWNKTHRALNAPVDTEIPIAVLISKNSASAAEIVSGVIQDYDRGVLVGHRSFGKGLVQATRPLSYNSKLKVTVAKYHIPSGRCIQAIDYSHRDINGYADKVPDSLRVAFKTKGGRTVYDGGGVDPDIPVDKENYAPIVWSLVSKGLIFDYATEFKLKHESIPPAKEFKLSQEEFNSFVAWLSDKEYDYTTSVEKMLAELIENAKAEKYYEDIKGQIDNLDAKISHNKETDLQKFKGEIMEVLEREISSRYYLQTGIIESSFDDDNELDAAIELLSDMDNYYSILSGEDS